MKNYWALKTVINLTHVVAIGVGLVALVLSLMALGTVNSYTRPDFTSILGIAGIFLFVVFIEAQAQLLQIAIDIAHNTEKL